MILLANAKKEMKSGLKKKCFIYKYYKTCK